jgi:micrococcal nuclease
MKTFSLLAALLLIQLSGVCPAADPSSAEAPIVNYTFNAKVVRVLAGDLVALDVDLGFGVWLHNQTFKLHGVTAPAPDSGNKEAVTKAKSNTQKTLVTGAEVVLQSIKDKTDKSGVYHAILWLNGGNLNAEIAKEAAGK